MGFHSLPPNGGNRCVAVGGGKTFAKSIFSRHSCLSASSCFGSGGGDSSCCKISRHLFCLESFRKKIKCKKFLFSFLSLNKNQMFLTSCMIWTNYNYLLLD